MQGSFLRLEALRSRLVSATCHRSCPPRLTPLRSRSVGEGRRYQQVLASNGSVTTSESLPKSSHRQAGLSDPDLHGPSTTKADQSEAEIGQRLARELVPIYLRENYPEGLLRAFSEASTNLEYVQSIPPSVFTEILQALHPGYFVEPYKDALEDLSSADLRTMGIRPVQTFFKDFVGQIQDIISKRRQAGKSLRMADFRMLLNCARYTGDAATADAIWYHLHKSKIKPDTACYNHYMEVKCWSGFWEAGQKHKLRVIPHNMAMRLPKKRREEFSGFQVGEPWGVKHLIVRLFDRMVREGMPGTERTFVVMMTAMGREGDLDGVKTILSKVWSVDVDKIMADDELPMEVVEVYPETSPLRPTSELLFAIAHIFGSNNDIPTALKLVDHFSRQYLLRIHRNVWSQLLEWTFVLSRPRDGRRKTDGASQGQLPLASVGSLWETMISEPYNVEPTMPMYNKYIANLNMRQSIKLTLRLMREAKPLLQDSYRAYRKALNNSLDALEQARMMGDEHSGAQACLVQVQRKLERARMRRARDYNYLKRWVRLLLGNRRWNNQTRSWDHRGMPDAIEEWRPFLPATARYDILTGTVELEITSKARSMRRIVRRRRHLLVLRMRCGPVDWKWKWSSGGVSFRKILYG